MVAKVSIHAPWEGCDEEQRKANNRGDGFQFTHPGKGATNFPETIQLGDVEFQFTHPGKGATLEVFAWRGR